MHHHLALVLSVLVTLITCFPTYIESSELGTSQNTSSIDESGALAANSSDSLTRSRIQAFTLDGGYQVTGSLGAQLSSDEDTVLDTYYDAIKEIYSRDQATRPQSQWKTLYYSRPYGRISVDIQWRMEYSQMTYAECLNVLELLRDQISSQPSFSSRESDLAISKANKVQIRVVIKREAWKSYKPNEAFDTVIYPQREVPRDDMLALLAEAKKKATEIFKPGSSWIQTDVEEWSAGKSTMYIDIPKGYYYGWQLARSIDEIIDDVTRSDQGWPLYGYISKSSTYHPDNHKILVRIDLVDHDFPILDADVPAIQQSGGNGTFTSRVSAVNSPPLPQDVESS